MSNQSVGIHGIGAYLPDNVRPNDWWSAATVEKWIQKKGARAGKQEGPAPELTPGQARVMAGMATVANDPFQGAKERRIAPDGMLSSEMELRAAQDALKQANVTPEDIDLLLVYSTTHDYLNAQNTCYLHRELGLNKKCLSVTAEGACNSFLLQMALAEPMIATGQVKRALLIQSCMVSRVIPAEANFAPWFGDGATAVVLGPVNGKYGILGRAHRTDGSYHKALVIGVPEKHWYDDGKCVLYAADAPAGFQMLLNVADMGKEVIDDCLMQANLLPQDLDFWAPHQASLWFREATRDHIGLKNAKTVDTFSWASSLSAANIPLALKIGASEGLLQAGDVIGMYSGGSGVTYSGFVMRWGV